MYAILYTYLNAEREVEREVELFHRKLFVPTFSRLILSVYQGQNSVSFSKINLIKLF
jgi:hypothetical protein